MLNSPSWVNEVNWFEFFGDGYNKEEGMEREKNITPVGGFQNILISDEIIGVASDIAEMRLDQFIEEEVWKDFPVIGTAIAVMKSIARICDYVEFKMQLAFIQRIRRGCADNKAIEKRRKAYQNKEKWFSDETERIVVYLARCSEYQKALIYAEIYLDYINEKITYEEMQEYFEINDRIILTDAKKLYSLSIDSQNRFPVINENFVDSDIIKIKDISISGRLVSLGLLGNVVGFSFGMHSVDLFMISDVGLYFIELMGRFEK